MLIQQRRRYGGLWAALLVIMASGMLVNNIRLFDLSGYPVTPSVIIAAIFYVLCFADWVNRRIPLRDSVPFSALFLILYELIVHGAIMGNFSNSEWLRSAALLVFCVGLLVVSGKLVVLLDDITVLARTVSILSYLMGGLGIIQFLYQNITGIDSQYLPESLMVRNVSAVYDSPRSAGLLRATGVSYEFSYYGIGMVVVATLCLVLLDMGFISSKMRRMLTGALIVAVAGVAVSVSFAAWGLLAVVLLVRVLTTVRSSRNRLPIVVGLGVFALFLLAVYPYLNQRWQDVLAGYDRSTNYRLIASLKLILESDRDMMENLIGTGVGLEQLSPRIWRVYSEYFSVFGRERFSVVNGIAYAVLTMGWVGLTINTWVVFNVFWKRNSGLVNALPLIILVLGYFFTNARYLWPEWWALLILSAVLAHAPTTARSAT